MGARRAQVRLTVLAVVLLLPLLAVGFGARATAVESSGLGGFTYTSPSFGYALVWRAPWFAVRAKQLSDGTAVADNLVLSDGDSTVTLVGMAADGGELGDTADLFEAAIADPATGMTNRSPISPVRCLRETSALPSEARCFRFDQRLADGSTIPMAAKLQVWEMDGVHLVMLALVSHEQFDAFVERWGELQVFPAGAEIPAGIDASAVETHGETTFVFDATIDPVERAEIVEGFAFGAGALDGFFGPLELGALRVTVLDAISPAAAWMAALTLEQSIAVFAGTDGNWRASSPLFRRSIVTHELTHIYQMQVLGDALSTVPRWFVEGSADMVAATAIVDAGLATFADFDALAMYQLGRNPTNETLAELPASTTIDDEHYPLAYLGVRHALEWSGSTVQALDEVLVAMATGASFADAFASVFGVSLEVFYVDFEAWRATLPTVDAMPAVFA